MEEKIFAALELDRQEYAYRLYLVNPTGMNYRKVETYTGAFCSGDEDLIETSRAAFSKGELRPYSWLLLEENTLDGLDFIVWHLLDLYPEDGVMPMEKLGVSVPKYPHYYEENSRYLPVIEKKCLKLEVNLTEVRSDISGQFNKDREENRIWMVSDNRVEDKLIYVHGKKVSAEEVKRMLETYAPLRPDDGVKNGGLPDNTAQPQPVEGAAEGGITPPQKPQGEK